MVTILSVFGTRPEAVKMAPIIKELQEHKEQVRSVICVTGQHREMLDQMLTLFGIVPDYDLALMEAGQTLTQLTARVLVAMEPVLAKVKPDWVLVQGDTTTVMAVALVAFYHQIKVGHIEAGLRTHNKRSPFPEEINRRLTTVVADLHFAPTEQARQLLLSEGVADEAIWMTGNTVVDALLWMRDFLCSQVLVLPERLTEFIVGRRLILVTAHRRENFDAGLGQICLALRDIVGCYDDVCVVYPVHLNPRVHEQVFELLEGMERILLIEPLPYSTFVWLMEQAYLVLTDSGGIQEEAPSLGKPVLVLRDTTERPEAIEAGSAVLVGTNRDEIVTQTRRILDDDSCYREMVQVDNPYGDGNAAKRIVQALLHESHL